MLLVDDSVSEVRGDADRFVGFIVNSDMNNAPFGECFVIGFSFGDVGGSETTVVNRADP